MFSLFPFSFSLQLECPWCLSRLPNIRLICRPIVFLPLSSFFSSLDANKLQQQRLECQKGMKKKKKRESRY